jgi:hypothetical protein
VLAAKKRNFNSVVTPREKIWNARYETHGNRAFWERTVRNARWGGCHRAFCRAFCRAFLRNKSAAVRSRWQPERTAACTQYLAHAGDATTFIACYSMLQIEASATKSCPYWPVLIGRRARSRLRFLHAPYVGTCQQGVRS